MEKFLARQPIFNSKLGVYGYELLYRAGAENRFFPGQTDVASASAADNLLLFGLDRLTQGRRAFVNCTRDFLLRDYPALLPKDRVVLEILEDVVIDESLLDACRRLKQAGYLLALDDYQESPDWQRLVSLADFIKVDLLATPPAEQLRLARQFAHHNVRLVAEKVETHEDFQRTLRWGYSFFQGYFFSRPQMVTHHDIPASKMNYLAVLQTVNRSPLDMEQVGQQIKAEASLSYRLLRYLNSPAFFLAAEIHSIPHALALLGERGVRKWVSLVAVACLAEEKPEELILLPLVRARFCEKMARSTGHAGAANDLFLLGLLSAMDAILDMKMEEVVQEVPVGREIREALLGEPNSLRRILDLVLLYEKGAWEEIERAGARLKIPEGVISSTYVEATIWAREILAGHPAGQAETR
ncbi:MAG: EAL domain-containing protein [Acidobacteriia bacterium]|nr:EAL domain-containing protein [Terriglobia bacterium]